MNNDVVFLVIAFGVSILFIIAFFRFMYTLLQNMRKSDDARAASIMQKPTKEELDTVITLTPDEQRSMMRSATAAVMIGVLLCSTLMIVMSVRYWQYVVEGERISATVTNISTSRSGTKRRRTKYTYTLQATVDGNVVRDTYSAGSYHSAKVRDVIDVYATSETPPQLAIAAVEDRDPFLVLLLAVLLGFLVFVMKKQRAVIATGRMKLRQFSEKTRYKKLKELRAGAQHSSAPMERSTTSDGKPMYTLNNESTESNIGNDGRDYRVQ